MDEFFDLTQQEDQWILMQRDAHFSSHFSLMIEYYERGGPAVDPEISIDRLRELACIERDQGEDLSKLLLSDAERARVQRARDAYQHLRSLFEDREPAKAAARWLARLLLTEKRRPLREIAAVVHFGKLLLPTLKEMLLSSDYDDPLFPGYGRAPLLLLRVLFHLKEPSLIPTLFSLLNAKEGFSVESAVLRVLVATGAPAREFLLRAMKALPWTEENSRAAMALAAFPSDPEIALEAAKLLQRVDLTKQLALYLVLLLIDLQDERAKIAVQQLEAPKELRAEIDWIAKQWK